MLNALPDLLCRFGKPEELSILRIYDAFIDQKVHVQHLTPVALTHQYYGKRLDRARLHQHESFEQFVESAVAAWKGDQGLGAEQKMKLAQREIMEPEA